MSARGFRELSLATILVMALWLVLTFFWVPIEADQGFMQKIFYVHVPIAIVALVGFVAAGVEGYRHLRTGDSRHDANSYVFIHISIVYVAAALATGMLWAKVSWGKYWIWEEPTLVAMLIIFLLYATYYPFRYAIEDRDQQARYSSVFALAAGIFVPLNFLAVRMAEPLIHPRVFASSQGGLPPSMARVFVIGLIGFALLWVLLVKLELLGKRTAGQMSRLKRNLEARADGTEPAAVISTGSRIAPDVAPERAKTGGNDESASG